MTLLARVYLLTNDWGNAAAVAEMVLEEDKKSTKGKYIFGTKKRLKNRDFIRDPLAALWENWSLGCSVQMVLGLVLECFENP